ncbi:hypothetical protein BDV37DRAFT_280987 [Aspergillus pseudonomiae]|uniref:Xylanolytic transcriptional activator regulatory domain-containing protein n=1 Tax=Aspergillus pseudonomiae TaxID=1506151 RepID=A0A5N7DJU5_9EURO|nr:uncharacterized protein BDV37DRAFT_280987 [Aspergillus pseudonomiae]KAE8406399.1 hypothetical protein BDV37DRAFT_280987 [Aspergillus pseudonomiae]
MEMGTDMMPTQPDTNAVRQSSPSQRPASFQIMNDSTSSPLLVNLGNPELLNELSTSSQSPKQCSLMDHRRLSWLVHPSHEPTSPAFEDGVDLAEEPLLDESSPVIHADLMSQICNALHTDNRDVHHLITLYFKNMVAFTLFSPHLLSKKLQSAPAPQTIILLAAMFSYSARFRPEYPFNPRERSDSREEVTPPTAHEFYLLSKKYIDQELMDLKAPPPLLLLQAMVLISFHELIESAEGKGWRSLGPLVRIAYELRLHLLDNNADDGSISSNRQLWFVKEERRRVWWAIWELDAFTSTVRRLPAAIDWNQNWTMLPVSDEDWFRGIPRKSCFLIPDPMERVKLLEACGNQSAKAWFIVANSLMRTAHCISNSQEYFWIPASLNPPQPGRRTPPTDVKSAHGILRNSVYYLSLALPHELRYRGQCLFSNVATASKSTKQRDSDIYSIHVMVALTGFMLDHRNMFGSVSGMSEPVSSPPQPHRSCTSCKNHDLHMHDRIQTQSLSMAEAILSLVRNSAPDHVQHVNPFLASTIWLAAAVFLVYYYLGISKEAPQEKALVDSNIALLKAVFRQFVEWWDMSDILETKLTELESELVRVREAPGSLIERSDEPQSLDKAQPASSSNPVSTDSEGLLPPCADYQPPLPGASMVDGTGYTATSGFRPDNVGPLFIGECTNLMGDRVSGMSNLFDNAFDYDLELQDFLDGMLATFRGPELWKSGADAMS